MISVFVYEHLTALGASGRFDLPLASSLYREGRAMFDALSSDFQSLDGVSVESVRSADPHSFMELARQSSYTLVIAPETGGVLEQRCRWVLAAGGRLLGPMPDGIRLAADKFALSEHWRRAGVPSPITWIGRRTDSYPVVWKPRDGCGSVNTFLILDDMGRRTAEAQIEPEGEMVTQPFIPGQAASVAFLVGKDSLAALLPCKQSLSYEGRMRYLGGAIPLPEPLRERAIALATRAVSNTPGLFGFVGVDLILGPDPSFDRVIELNPRLTTSYVGLRYMAKFNMAEMMLKLVRHEPLPELNWRDARITFSPDGIVNDHPIANTGFG